MEAKAGFQLSTERQKQREIMSLPNLNVLRRGFSPAECCHGHLIFAATTDLTHFPWLQERLFDHFSVSQPNPRTERAVGTVGEGFAIRHAVDEMDLLGKFSVFMPAFIKSSNLPVHDAGRGEFVVVQIIFCAQTVRATVG